MKGAKREYHLHKTTKPRLENSCQQIQDVAFIDERFLNLRSDANDAYNSVHVLENVPLVS